MSIPHLYVAYANYGGYPVHIELLDEARYNKLKGMQPKDDRIHQATLHNDSTDENDPILDILAVTEHRKLNQQLAEEISQEVIDWLMENGHMPMK